MLESRSLKTLALLFDQARSSNNLPWLPPDRSHPIPLLPPVFSDFAPSAASPRPPPPLRSFLSSLLPQDVWSGKAFSLTGLNSISLPTVALSVSSSAFFNNDKQTGQVTRTGGSSMSGRSPIDRTWTNVLLASNVLAYGAQIATRGQLTSWGAKINYQIAQGQTWRLVTSAFLHADIVHLLINCYSLNSVGSIMEHISGPGRFLAIYFTSAVASSAMSYRFTKATSVGASGAIAGLLGAYAVYLLRHRDQMSDGGTRAMQNIGHIIAINLVFGLAVKGIDNWGHLGGLLGGAATAWLLGPAWKYETSSIDGRRVLTDRAPISYILNLGSRER